MYGFVNSALEKLIKRRFGVEKWNEIRTHAKLFLGDKDSFHVNHIYNDDDTYSVVAAASEVLGLDAATILEMFGEQFLLSCQESGYAKTLQLLGRTLQDFLTNLDALHDHLSIIYPQMDAPSFRCTAGVKKSEFLLHYYSDRDSLEHIVMGIVKSVAREYYHVELEMKVMVKKGEKSDHTIFSIREVGYHKASIIDKEDQDQDIKSYSDRNLVSSATFCKAFPFHIIFDSRMTILQVGSSLSWVMPNLQLNKDNLTNYFNLERPRMKLTFENILSHINTIYILRMSPMTTSSSTRQKHNSDRLSFSIASGSDPMRLRGQMVYTPESEAMLFICSPRVKRLHSLEQRGLYLSDIPIHDATRGMLMMSQAAAAEFSRSVHLEDLIIDLNSTQKSLEEEKKRMSDLLHQMLPISVADSLMAGQMVEAERFESVTILFSDIVGFTSICGHSEPMDIVNMLNKLYSLFDQVVGQNRVYKVETIGDAYMVVGGLPERNTIHAECIANQALDMMHYCKQVQRPDNSERIMMRIGIHSGPVVAGVVGRRMPRYCLFGNTVNVASRTESNGTPGKIQVTQYTYNLLKDKPSFKFEVRGSIVFKNVPEPVECYYLIDNNLDRETFTPIIITDDTEFHFSMLSRTPATPPATPRFMESSTTTAHGNLEGIISQPNNGCPMFGLVPDFNVIKPTPDVTPNPTPPGSERSSLSNEPPGITMSSPTPPLCQHPLHKGNKSLDSDDEESVFSETTPPVGDLQEEGENETLHEMDHHHFHPPTSFMLTMRNTSMSPLKEDFSEEDTGVNLSLINLDEGIEMQRKISDVSGYSMDSGNEVEPLQSGAKHTNRKTSDTSNHSGESGIDSSKLTSDERKLSNSSSGSMEEELAIIRRSRAGSVTKAVEKYDNLTHRIRKSGINMVCSTTTHDSYNGKCDETSVAT